MKIEKPGLQMQANRQSDRFGLDRLTTMSNRSTNRDFALNMYICILMLILNFGCVAYVIARGPVDTSVSVEFVITVIFLLAPLVGGCSAFRLTRSADRSAKIIGWLLVVVFALFLVNAAMVDWAQYRYDQEILRG